MIEIEIEISEAEIEIGKRWIWIWIRTQPIHVSTPTHNLNLTHNLNRFPWACSWLCAKSRQSLIVEEAQPALHSSPERRGDSCFPVVSARKGKLLSPFPSKEVD